MDYCNIFLYDTSPSFCVYIATAQWQALQGKWWLCKLLVLFHSNFSKTFNYKRYLKVSRDLILMLNVFMLDFRHNPALKGCLHHGFIIILEPLLIYIYKINSQLFLFDFSPWYVVLHSDTPLWKQLSITRSEVPVVQWLSSLDMDTATRVQILDLTDCISHSTNTLGKGMNLKYSPSSYG